jgi:photosystem II stability/assembly factor-like uncharacterized protein
VAATSDKIIRSEDGGRTWTGTLFEGDALRELVTDPLSPDSYYAIIERPDWVNLDPRLVHTIDAGRTWTPIMVPTPMGRPTPVGGVTHVMVVPVSPPVLLATIPGSLIRSADGGATWTSRSAPGPIVALASAPSDPRIVFGVGAPQDPDSAGLWKSGDSATTWERLEGAPLPLDLVVDPNDARVLYVIPIAVNKTVAPSFPPLQRSIDGGQSWQPLPFVTRQDRGAVALTPARPGTVFFIRESGAIAEATADGTTVKDLDGWAGLLMFDPLHPDVLYAAGDRLYRRTLP